MAKKNFVDVAPDPEDNTTTLVVDVIDSHDVCMLLLLGPEKNM